MFNLRQFSGVVALLGAVLALTAVPTAQKARKTSNIAVTTTLADLGAAEHPLRVQSDRKGPYVTKTLNRTKEVDSVLIVNPTGTDWSLTTYYVSKGSYAASDRKVLFDLREQAVAGSFATPILGTDAYGCRRNMGSFTAHLTAKCSVVNIDMTKMTTGATVFCPGSFRFRAPDGLWYRFSFQPDNFPQVDRFLVTCTQADGTGCKVWTVTSGSDRVTGTDPNTKSLNTLLHIDEGGAFSLSGAITTCRSRLPSPTDTLRSSIMP